MHSVLKGLLLILTALGVLVCTGGCDTEDVAPYSHPLFMKSGADRAETYCVVRLGEADTLEWTAWDVQDCYTIQPTKWVFDGRGIYQIRGEATGKVYQSFGASWGDRALFIEEMPIERDGRYTFGVWFTNGSSKYQTNASFTVGGEE